MTNRQKTARIKKELRAAYPEHRFSVRWGRGTASGWVYVITDCQDRENIKKVAAQFAGEYLSDSLPGSDTYNACVRVEVVR